MDVAKAFTFVTEDEKWVGKIGIGALISMASVLLLPAVLLVGYLVGITRNVMNGEEAPLPEWEDLGALFRDGLAVLVALFVYTLPFLALLCVAAVASLGLGGLAEVSEEAAMVGIFATSAGIICLATLFAIVIFFLSPAIVIQYVRTGEIEAAFRFAEVFAIARARIGDIIITALASFVAVLLLNAVVAGLAFIPCIGWVGAPILALAGNPWLVAVTGHLYGQIAEKEDKAARFA
jgi:hypothetical protein